jgi:hypothetical protein
MMRKIISAAVALAFFAVLQATVYAAPPVDGFLGVPWGASRQQVQKAMEERGFTLLEQRADGYSDTYRGTFVGKAAELTFFYEEKIFYRGQAAFIHVKGRDYHTVKAWYAELRDLLAAKYGRPYERTALDANPVSYSKWENLPAAAEPPGRIKIFLQDGPHKFRDGTDWAHTVIVSYDIGSSWVRQRTATDLKDL